MTEIAATEYARVLMRVLLGAVSAAVVVGMVAAAPAVADPAPPPGDCGGRHTVAIADPDHAMPPLGTSVPPDPNLRAPAPVLRPCQ